MHACTFVCTLTNMHARVLVIDPEEAGVAKLVLRRDRLAQFRKLKGITTDADLAERIGVNAGQVSRVLKGKSAPGPRFIAGILDVFGIEFFADLFAVEPDDNGEAA